MKIALNASVFMTFSFYILISASSGKFSIFSQDWRHFKLNWRIKIIILAADYNVHFGTNQTKAVTLCNSFSRFGFKKVINFPTRSTAYLNNSFKNLLNIFINFQTDFINRYWPGHLWSPVTIIVRVLIRFII